MMYSALVVAFLAFATASLAANDFSAWKNTVGRKSRSPEELSVREQIFDSNTVFINRHNAETAQGKHTYTLGWGPFADVTRGEWRDTFLNTAKAFAAYSKLPRNEVIFPERQLATSVDWRTKGAVTPVKNQDQCGSCWSFSATGSIEGAWKIAGNELVLFSEQQLVDCSSKFENRGCNGGLMDNAFQYVEANGLNTESDYPYTAKTGQCDTTKAAKSAVIVKGYYGVPKSNEDALGAAVAKGPVSAAVEADNEVFQFYKSGIVDSASCGTSLDHGVLVVGYGSDSGKAYWIVKNSWGATWGDQGYIMIEKGANVCGIADAASSAEVGKGPHRRLNDTLV